MVAENEMIALPFRLSTETLHRVLCCVTLGWQRRRQFGPGGIENWTDRGAVACYKQYTRPALLSVNNSYCQTYVTEHGGASPAECPAVETATAILSRLAETATAILSHLAETATAILSCLAETNFGWG